MPPRGNPEKWQCALFNGLLCFTRNDNGDKKPGISTPLSLRASAARAAIQESGNVHYLLDCFAMLAMTREMKGPITFAMTMGIK